MLQTRPKGIYYPAKVLAHEQGHVDVEWYDGNIYGRNQKPMQKGPFTITAVMCMSAHGPVAADRLYTKVCHLVY
jgi:hypothetical protein